MTGGNIIFVEERNGYTYFLHTTPNGTHTYSLTGSAEKAWAMSVLTKAVGRYPVGIKTVGNEVIFTRVPDFIVRSFIRFTRKKSR